MPVKSPGYVINSRKLLRRGHGWSTPNDGSVCQVIIHHVSGDSTWTAAKSQSAMGQLEMTIGTAATEFDDAIEQCLGIMKSGEMVEIHLSLKEPRRTPMDVVDPTHQRVPGNENREVGVNEDTNQRRTLAQGQHEDEDHTECNVWVQRTEPEKANTEVSETIRVTDISALGEHCDSLMTVTDSGQCGDTRGCVLHVSLLDVKQATDVWRLTTQEKLTLAQQYKSVGAQLYCKGSTECAFRKFSRALKYLILVVDDEALSAEARTLNRKLRCQCYMNLAACQLKHANSTGVIANCTKGLALEPNNVKGLFRRAQAYVMQKEHDAAYNDLQEALEIEPNNGAIWRLVRKVKASLQKENAQMAAAFAKLACGDV